MNPARAQHMTIQVRSVTLAKYSAIARGLGIDPLSMLRHVGLAPGYLATPDLRIPEISLAHILDASSKTASSNSLGLLMGETWRLSDFGVLSLLLQHQQTLRQTLSALHHYRHLLSDSVAIDITEHPQVAVLRCALVTERRHPGRQPVELALAALFSLCRHQLGPHWMPRQVHFVHAAPQHTGIHHRVFGAHLEFGSDFDGIVLDKGALDQINPSSDPNMARYAQDFIELQPRSEPRQLRHAVLRAVHMLMPRGQHSIAQVGQQLGMSARTLQRQLEQEGANYQTLLNGVRREQALRLIAARAHSITEIAQLLGFAETSPFSRWFNQQFGVSPSRWKED
ncbi:MAG: AraC family transcriptional regulator [Pseudomonadota bacterium]